MKYKSQKRVYEVILAQYKLEIYKNNYYGLCTIAYSLLNKNVIRLYEYLEFKEQLRRDFPEWAKGLGAYIWNKRFTKSRINYLKEKIAGYE